MAHGQRAAKKSNSLTEFNGKRLGSTGYFPRGKHTKKLTHVRERQQARKQMRKQLENGEC